MFEGRPLTYEMFVHDYTIMCARTKLRQGQLAFNNLWAIRPDLSERIRATDLDPFYDDSRLGDFFAYVEAQWGGTK